MNTQGVTAASSNRGQADSFVGKNYSFRRYFTKAVHGAPDVYMALGVTSKKRGVYYSHPVYAPGGEAPVGVLIIKTSTEMIEKLLLSHHFYENGMLTLITAPLGVVFISDQEQFLNQLVWKIPAEKLAEIRASRQFGVGPWRWAGFARVDKDNVIDAAGNLYLMDRANIEFLPGWNIVHLMNLKAPLTQLSTPSTNAISTLILVLVCMVGLSVFVLYRMGRISILRRMEMDRALRESEAEKKAILDGITSNIAFVDRDLKVLWVNRTAAESVNQQSQDMLGRRCHEFWADPSAPCQGCPTVKAFQTRTSEHAEMVTPDGRIWDERGEPVFDPDGNLIGVVEIARDITDQKQTEIALQQSEARYRRLTENALDIIWRMNTEGKILFVNAAVERLLGYSATEIIGLEMDKYMVRKSVDRLTAEVAKALAEQPPRSHFRLEVEYMAKDGRILPCEVVVVILLNEDGQVSGYEGISRDVSEKIRIEKELRQAHKMEAIGTLAGGIAHEFNNILSIVLGNAELALHNVPESNKAHLFLSEIRVASLRGRDVVKQLLSFSRNRGQGKRALRLSSVVEGSLGLLRASIPANIAIELEVAENIQTIVGDQTQIYQVMINLCTNAAHAMEEHGGKLKIAVDNVVLERPEPFFDQVLEPGDYVRLCISDTGYGISADSIDRVFDPFYTTKEVGRGSGMGLAVVLGIVKGHGGAIWIKSIPKQGTQVNCYFPAVNAESHEEVRAETAVPGGKETILFVDDEEALVRMSKQWLESLGYTVETSTNPIDALESFRNSDGRFDLVITDMSMPHMTGDHFIRELLKIRPDVKTIICTGYSSRLDEQRASEIGACEHLVKPIEANMLAETVRKVLDHPNEMNEHLKER